MSLKFYHVRTATLRETLACGRLSEVERGLLKRYGDRLNWSTKEKTTLLDMATDVFNAKTPFMEFEVHIRSLCHSSAVTADYVQRSERFNLKRCLLVLGNVGEVMASWAELVQPALYLYERDFNIIWMEVPSFSTNAAKWLRYGPGLVLAGLRELQVDSVSVMACGVGGTLFMATLAQCPQRFASTHVIYNQDLPRGCKVVPYPVQDLEDALREREMQLWFLYNDEAGVFDRSDWGTPLKAYEFAMKLQVRLEGERRRGLRQLDYDEVLITEHLNYPRVRRVERLPIGRDVLLAFTEAFLESVAHLLEFKPRTYQDDLDMGLVPVTRGRSRGGSSEEPQELPALRRLRLGPDTVERLAIADSNRQRLNWVRGFTLPLAVKSKRVALPPPVRKPKTIEKEPLALAASVSMPALEVVAPREPESESEEEEESIFGEFQYNGSSTYADHRGLTISDAYHEMWLAVRGNFD